MSPIAPALAALGERVASLTAQLGRRVDVDALRITDRQGLLPLDAPTQRSPNRACRLIRAADGWVAVNLAREEDRELVAAWLRRELEGDPWDAIARAARTRACADLIADACLLGLPAARVGEVRCRGLAAPTLRLGAETSPPSGRTLQVIDLTALWAGPMCGAILAEMGALVTKVESTRRPDPTRASSPEFFRRLNGRKQHLGLDLTDPAGQAQLRRLAEAADVLITSARPRAFASLGFDPQTLFAANPGLVWVAITGYGWTGEGAGRVAFGDDAAAAGGLVRWTATGAPMFLGDALADPVAGLGAAAAALEGLLAGGGVLADVAMARSAAGAAALCGLAAA